MADRNGVLVQCGECRHPATISAASDAWKCNCWAGVSEDPDCLCEAQNETPGTEDNPPDTAAAEVQQLERRLVELRGSVAPTGVQS